MEYVGPAYEWTEEIVRGSVDDGKFTVWYLDGDRLAAAFVPRGSDGLTVVETWDALGMRSSGSHDLLLDQCFVPAPMVLPAGEWGMGDDFGLTFHMAGNLGLLGVFVGIAEAARDLAVDAARTRRKAPDNRTLAERPPIRHTVACMEVDLVAARAVLDRVSGAVDAYFATHLTHQTERHELQLLMKEYVCAKQVVNAKAIDVVDGALTVSGGAGYLTANPLSRLYRDVRAGPFMQAYSPNEAFDYVGRVALGLEPVVDL
jgi:alkylation response protein AidB-like acyl-CoA dehydrogenase